MERLTVRNSDEHVDFISPIGTTLTANSLRAATIQVLLDRLASYEDAEAQGLLVRLPCKVGDTVWIIRTASKTGTKCACKGTIINFTLTTDSVLLIAEYKFYGIEEGRFEWGKNAFATRKEAESVLKEASDV